MLILFWVRERRSDQQIAISGDRGEDEGVPNHIPTPSPSHYPRADRIDGQSRAIDHFESDRPWVGGGSGGNREKGGQKREDDGWKGNFGWGGDQLPADSFKKNRWSMIKWFSMVWVQSFVAKWFDWIKKGRKRGRRREEEGVITL